MSSHPPPPSPGRAEQTDLFASGPGPGSEPASTPDGVPVQVGPARVPDELRRTADALPPRIRLGTSSWSFPGWAGIVWDRAAPGRVLSRHGLAAYARHPLLRTVGVDRSYYRSLDREAWASYARAVPDDFSFLAKAERVLVHPGDPAWLDPGYASEVVVGPFREGLGPRAGPLVFQFPPLRPGQIGGARAFAERLYRFLDGLPPGPLYAVEIRTPGLLTGDYAQALTHAGATHVYTVHPRAPSLERQREVVPPGGGPLVVRWMLRPGAGYEEARDLYRPFDTLMDPDPGTRSTLAQMAVEVAAAGGLAWVAINNKAEGSAPLSVRALAERIVAEGEAG